MGTSTSAREFGAKLHKLSQQIGDVKPALIEGAEVGKALFRASAASAGVLGSTVEGKRKPVGVKDDFVKIQGQDGVVVTYTGPAHLVNNPTKPHFIGARRLGSRRRLAGLSAGVGAVTAFGGTAQGMFGSLLDQRTTRSGVQRQASRALKIEGNFRPYAFHPGTPGKGFFQSAKPKVVAVVPRVVANRQLTQPLRAIFR